MQFKDWGPGSKVPVAVCYLQSKWPQMLHAYVSLFILTDMHLKAYIFSF